MSKNFKKWENIYLSNKKLNEEMEYVLLRKQYDTQIGNSLPLPSLLLKRNFQSICKNENEELEDEIDYKSRKDRRHRSESSYSEPFNRYVYEKYDNKINNCYYNFIKNTGYSLNNIKPVNIDTNEENAKFEIKLENNLLNKYNYMQIILIDGKTVSSNLLCLSENDDNYKIEKKDISNIKSLDSGKNYTERNKVELIYKGDIFKINTLSNYTLIDSVLKLSKFYLMQFDDKAKDKENWDKFKFIFSLDSFNEDEFIKNYNEVCGHEINLFLYFKYPELFNKYVKNIIKYKFEKAFIDYFLLDDYDTLIQYLTPLKIKSLDTFELCLLVIKLINKNILDAEKIKNIIKSRIIPPKKIENHLLTNFNLIINMTPKESKNKDNKEKNEEENDDDENIENSDDKKNKKNNMIKYRKTYKGKASLNNAKIKQSGASGYLVRRMDTSRCAARTSCCLMDECSDDDEDDDIDSDNVINLIQLDTKARKNNYNYAVNKAEKEISHEFETPGNAKEYNERHNYLKNEDSKIDNPLWLDFAEYIIKEKTFKKFLSKNILYNKNINLKEIIYILSVIDLPINSVEHIFKRNKRENKTIITSNSNIILFIKEIAESPLDLNNKLLINQRINDITYKENNININNCSINIEYAYQVIVTNISNKVLNFQLFIQIPEGAIGLDTTFYNNTFQIELKAYETKEYKIYFYFPKEGTFMQYFPVASQNNKIISLGNSLIYKVKKEYTPIYKAEISDNDKYEKDRRNEGKLRNILADNNISSENKLDKILDYFKKDIFNEEDINNILYLLKNDKEFFIKLIKVLRNRGYYNEKVWSFGFYHKEEESIIEYLSINNDLINNLGYDFKSKLYSYNDINDAKLHPHLEYNPISIARKHPFGINNQNNNLTQIANIQFKETYEKFIIDLLSLQELTIKEKLQLSYYLIIQDRLDEALDIFNRIKKEEIQINNNNKSYRIQYDYIYAYLDFTFGYPDFKIAKSLCNYYKDFPIIHWKKKFQEIEEELLIYEMKDKNFISMDIVEEDNKDIKYMIKDLKQKEPKLSFNIDSTNGKIKLLYKNINEININFYFIDLEFIFTREPKISEIINKSIENNNDNKNRDYIKEQFSFVKPNYSEKIELPVSNNSNGLNSTIYEIPKIYQKKNFLIDVNYESIKLLDLYLNSNLNVIITESIGEIKVLEENLKPLCKAYVKVYIKLESNNIEFYKDGYTDLNGNFNYLILNTEQLKNAKKFYIFVSEEVHGDTLKECFPPKNIDNFSNEDILEEIKRNKINKRNLWLMLSKKRKGPSFEEIFGDKQ